MASIVLGKMQRGKLVNIRPLEPNDLDWFTEWNNNPEYKGPYEPLETFTREEIEEWFRSEKKAEWWVITDKLGNPLGQLVTGPREDYYWLGYILHPDHRNKGYTTEAVKLLVDHLFASTDTSRVQAECNPENIASVRVLEKAGFSYEGLKRKAIFIQGKHMDSTTYCVYREGHPPY